MKRTAAVLLILALAFSLAACGAREPERETASPERTSASAATAEQTDAEKETGDPKDWEAAYTAYLKTLTDDSENISALDYAEYAFVTMPGLEYPALVLFGGWRDFYFYTFENGKLEAVTEDYEGEEHELIVGWADMPVYMLDGKLYLCGGNGAPATIFMDEVAVRDGTLKRERVAAVTCASAFGDRDYYYGRGDEEITESEYKAIVDGVGKNAEEVEFFSVKELKG